MTEKNHRADFRPNSNNQGSDLPDSDLVELIDEDGIASPFRVPPDAVKPPEPDRAELAEMRGKRGGYGIPPEVRRIGRQ